MQPVDHLKPVIEGSCTCLAGDLTPAGTDAGSAGLASSSQRSSPRSPPSPDGRTCSPPTSRSSPARSSLPPAPRSWARREHDAMGTATATETPSSTPDGGRPDARLRRLWEWILDVMIGIKVPLGLFFLVVVIGAVTGASLFNRTEYIDAQQRASDKRETIAAAYAADLRTYDLAVAAREDCLDRVARSDLNRGQHEATVTAFENLKTLFPDSASLAAAVDQVVADLQAGPLLSSAPLTVDDCPPPPDPPQLPPELGGGR